MIFEVLWRKEIDSSGITTVPMDGLRLEDLNGNVYILGPTRFVGSITPRQEIPIKPLPAPSNEKKRKK